MIQYAGDEVPGLVHFSYTSEKLGVGALAGAGVLKGLKKIGESPWSWLGPFRKESKRGPVTFHPTSGSNGNSPSAHAMMDPLVEGMQALNLGEADQSDPTRRDATTASSNKGNCFTTSIFERGRAMKEVYGGGPERRQGLPVSDQERVEAQLPQRGDILAFEYPRGTRAGTRRRVRVLKLGKD